MSRTRGATVAAFACWAFGAIGVAFGLGMMGLVPLPHGDAPEAAAALPSGAPIVAFGALRVLAAAGFVVAGCGLWGMRSWARPACLVVALTAIALNVAEPLVVFHGFPRESLVPTVMGSAWPAILVVACLHPDWRAAFRDPARQAT